MKFVFNTQEKEAHRTIRRIMHTRLSNDNMPIFSKYGTRQDLIKCWEAMGYVSGVEIGTLRGEYAAKILTLAPSVKLVCIDPWEVYEHSKITSERHIRNYEKAIAALSPFIKNKRCTIIKNKSESAVGTFPDGSLDFVYIDGDHTFDAAAMDLILWSRKVRPGGMIALHDYIPTRRGGVIQAVNAYVQCHNVLPWYVTREALPTAFWIKAESDY